MIHVLATIHLHPGARDAYLSEIRRIGPTVRAEAGCIDYAPAIDVDTGLPSQAPLRPDSLTVIERWATLDALKAHDAAPHMAEFRRRVKDLVRAREIRMLTAA